MFSKNPGAKAVVLKALERIKQPGGWKQGAGGRRSCACVAEALAIAYEDLGCVGETVQWQAILDAVREATGEPWIVKWNDAPGRTQQEAVDALCRSAKLLC